MGLGLVNVSACLLLKALALPESARIRAVEMVRHDSAGFLPGTEVVILIEDSGIISDPGAINVPILLPTIREERRPVFVSWTTEGRGE